MPPNCILCIVLFSCIYLSGAALAQEKEPGWQMDIVNQMFNGSAMGKQYAHINGIYYSDVCSWPELSCDLNLRIKSWQISTVYFSFTIPPQIGQLADLEVLSIQDGVEEVNATIPESIGNLTNLRSLKLGSRLYGTIPNSLKNLKELESLDVYGNFLSGTIPAGLASLPKLKTLFLGYNRLNGTIPDELMRGPCERMDLSGNQLTGSIPPVVFESGLKMLLMWDNRLTIFAKNIPRPPQLEYCNLAKNPFVCPIPQWATNVRQLAA